jgi:hypothetical protein
MTMSRSAGVMKAVGYVVGTILGWAIDRLPTPLNDLGGELGACNIHDVAGDPMPVTEIFKPSCSPAALNPARNWSHRLFNRSIVLAVKSRSVILPSVQPRTFPLKDPPWNMHPAIVLLTQVLQNRGRIEQAICITP